MPGSLDEFLEKSKLFALLDAEGRARLARVAVQVTYPAGAKVVSEGDEGDAFYATLSGTLRVQADDGLGGESHIATLMPGSVFGEIAALTREPRTATVVATTPARLLKFEAVGVLSILKDYPEVLANLQRLGVERSEALVARMIEG